MNIRIQWFAVLFLLGSALNSSTAQDVLSLFPLFTEREGVPEPAAEGIWSEGKPGGDSIRIQRAGDNFYHLFLAAQASGAHFEAVFLRVGDDMWMDLSPVLSDTAADGFYKEHLLRLHSFYRVRIEADTMRLAWLEYGWFYKNVVADSSGLPHSWSETSPFFTMPTGELQKFIGAEGSKAGFLSNELPLYRVAPPSGGVNMPEGHDSVAALSHADAGTLVQPCTPAFPLVDGWLGGDGDLSVPLDSSRTLWIFSDSFVGKKEQTSRSGAKMVANTIAISHCTSGGRYAIKYYWRKPFSDHPEPFFQSFTGRYRFWPCGALMAGGDLFVLMQKVGSKPEAQPGDIFNFNIIGMTLARIDAPASADPKHWNIQLFPWSQVIDPEAWGCWVAEGEFLYLFTKGKINRPGSSACRWMQSRRRASGCNILGATAPGRRICLLPKGWSCSTAIPATA